MGDFVGHLRGLGKRRFTLEELRTAHLAAFPEAADALAPRRLLLEALEDARAAGHIALPHTKYWERTGTPHLPKSATLYAEGLAAGPVPWPVAWVPELAFAYSERGRYRTALTAINRFLLRHRNTALREVPVNERSLQIFGNEKRLETDLDTDGSTLFGGRIPLGLIGCRPVTPPLAFEKPNRPAPGMPVLVLENLHPWESFRLWNATRGSYAAIACGYGNALRKTHRQLEQVAELPAHPDCSTSATWIRRVWRSRPRSTASGRPGVLRRSSRTADSIAGYCATAAGGSAMPARSKAAPRLTCQTSCRTTSPPVSRSCGQPER
ncbi:MAG: hypothetical protein OXE86_20810 [Alphaproteobacteria bacterium]|nr:hypothetical protein [Alphaproteobacteria bacterium]